MQVPHDGVVKVLAAGAVQTHVVGVPADAEPVTASRQLADQVGESLVEGIAAVITVPPVMRVLIGYLLPRTWR
jgi:hypothetical protein